MAGIGQCSTFHGCLLDLKTHSAATTLQVTEDVDSIKEQPHFSLHKWATSNNGNIFSGDKNSSEELIRKSDGPQLRHRGTPAVSEPQEKNSSKAEDSCTADDQVILAVGTKLQGIITRMALEITERHAVIQGMPLVKVSDKHFWFEWPELVLHLIHYVLFENAFELTYVVWTWYEFGFNSCFHEDKRILWIRIVSGVGVQFLCSYITLPLYALVTQMGSTMKKSIFDDQTSKALMIWHSNAKKKGGLAGFAGTKTMGAAKKTLATVKSTASRKVEKATPPPQVNIQQGANAQVNIPVHNQQDAPDESDAKSDPPDGK